MNRQAFIDRLRLGLRRLHSGLGEFDFGHS